MERLNRALQDLQDFPAEQLGDRALLRRVDTKFLCAVDVLPGLIRDLGPDFGLLRAGGRAIASYRTLYFDSPDQRLYHQHRRGSRDRYKIRIRHYMDRTASMLEVKRKSNHGVTSKSRHPHPFADHELKDEERIFLAEQTPCEIAEIVPQIWTDFRRITLVGLSSNERLTIDLDVSFTDGRARRQLADLAIVEVKQPRLRPRSTSMLALRARHIRRASMSKYCTGQAVLHPDLRQNRFRSALRTARRLRRV